MWRQGLYWGLYGCMWWKSLRGICNIVQHVQVDVALVISSVKNLNRGIVSLPSSRIWNSVFWGWTLDGQHIVCQFILLQNNPIMSKNIWDANPVYKKRGKDFFCGTLVSSNDFTIISDQGDRFVVVHTFLVWFRHRRTPLWWICVWGCIDLQSGQGVAEFKAHIFVE